jgi:hypothetical protein
VPPTFDAASGRDDTRVQALTVALATADDRYLRVQFQDSSEPGRHRFDQAVEVVRNGFITPHHVTSLPGKISGCVYRADGSKVTLSERFGGFWGDLANNDNPDTIDVSIAAKALKGRGLYLGHFMGGHYGHFITEGLSTFWILEEQSATGFDYFVFHPFAFGVAIPAYARNCLERFTIPVEKIVFVGEERLTFSELVVPERLFRLNHSADVRSRWTYQTIAAAAPAPPSAPNRIYLSRRQFNRRQFERVVANEVEIEDVFRANGFEIVYPETLTFSEQVALCARASVIAGISGSGLHNGAFMRSGTLLIELGDPRYDGRPAPTQALCNHIAGVRSAFIPFAGAMFGPKSTMLFDVSSVETALTEILGPRTARPALHFPLNLKHAMEIAYLAARPAVGFWARRFIRRR